MRVAGPAGVSYAGSMKPTLTLQRDAAQRLMEALQPMLVLAQKTHMGLALLPVAPAGSLQASAVNSGLALARAVREFELALHDALADKSARPAESGSGPADLTPV